MHATVRSCKVHSISDFHVQVSTIIEDNGEEAVEGAVDDADAEFINDTLENHVVTGEGLLAQFVYVHGFEAYAVNAKVSVNLTQFDSHPDL